MIDPALLRQAAAHPGPAFILTGAGISAESGIPTFRGPEGYWRVGSRNYQATELATHAAFAQMPEEVWAWYLYRRGVCAAAQPNDAHAALVALERALGDRFLLVTQNVDGLHLRAGNSAARTYQIHGNIHFCRCAGGCTPPQELPSGISEAWEKERRLSEPESGLLMCDDCGAWLRPHVLWFDESYDEPLYRFDSALAAAQAAALLVVVGTSGATTLPTLICETAAARGIPFVVVDPEPTPFAALAAASPAGAVVRATACEAVPTIAKAIAGKLAG